MRDFFVRVSTLVVLVAACAGFFSCASSAQTSSGGRENAMYLQFHSGGTLEKDVDVVIDGTIKFKAETYTDSTQTIQSYAVKPGTHTVEVFHNGKLIARKKIFGSMQETKVVELP